MSGTPIDSKGSDWPEEIEHDYERVRPLGEGAFGVVWLAKTKKNRRETAATHDHDDDSVDSCEKEDTFGSTKSIATYQDDPPYVAIKQINAAQDGEKEYAAREISILSEINHPNVVRCLRSVEMPRSRLVVLTLADGPDMNELVETGGALSTSLVRLAARHLISVVAYLHGVIHRDIKPDNCILAKVDTSSHNQSNGHDWMANDAFWDDKADFNEKEWKIVLVDFGFARALTPEEVGVSDDLRSSSSGRRRSSVRHLVQRGIVKQASQHESLDTTTDNTSTPQMRKNSSFERVPLRAMSALGTRAFAAPEVTKVREKSARGSALTDHVADYGLIADAFSIGCTIKVLLTGVPADKNEMEFISSQNNLLNIISAIFSCGNKNNGKRKKRYKFLDETPKPACELVRKLMKPLYVDRLTVPLARDEPWVKGGMSAGDPVVTLPTGDIAAGNDDPIKCLNCASRL